jgi:hypothetical protein
LVQNILLPRRNRASAQPLATWLGFHHAAFYQLKRMMQGVLARGTARSIANFAPYVAGKTGASDDGNEAKRLLSCKATGEAGEMRHGGGINECFRVSHW